MNHLNVLVIDNQAVYRNAIVKILSVFKSINQCDSVQNGIDENAIKFINKLAKDNEVLDKIIIILY